MRPTFDPILEDARIPVFVVATGRSGTHFLAQVMGQDPSIASYHLDDINASVGDSFLCYCTWNRLPVDVGGFLAYRVSLINSAGEAGQVYFEANPYLALNVDLLATRLGARFIYIVRRPEDVVNSHYVKGWYNYPISRETISAVHGYQYDVRQPNHFFGQLVPRGEEFGRWQKLSRIGKVAWMWNIYNLEIIRQLNAIQHDQWILEQLEEIDYARYLELHSFVGGRVPLTQSEFAVIRQMRPGKATKHRTGDDWSAQEWQEFKLETRPARQALTELGAPAEYFFVSNEPSEK